ncbi:RluA family pseudouridine synthase [Roseibacillus ishigakijimensis]|uniref:RNA pseudouridine synthase n=1 Tax=Roseibacillus ishigakijimensis TaxID=454146 RepID=A0A934RWP0_9BACT|nr:RNA pseudouridine synthase [Roseibacillus ishigakijimensis]MBK1835530.1 RNA pseudouridine synthase [Roseibacillus ishigakijimensis]
MSDNDKNFKKPPKKYHPKGITFLYEDRDLLVVDKASGLLTVSSEKVRENTAYFLLTDYVRKGNPKAPHRVFIVHRLDRDTSGVLVFAKSEKAKHFLQEQWPEFRKVYYAVVEGAPPEKEGVITSYLAENKAHKVYSTPDKKRGKLARTAYRVLKQGQGNSLLEIELLTGRKNQIRVHLADVGCPVVGDKKYRAPEPPGEEEEAAPRKPARKGPAGRKRPRLALHSASLTLVHPFSKKEMTFDTIIPPYFESLVRRSPES